MTDRDRGTDMTELAEPVTAVPSAVAGSAESGDGDLKVPRTTPMRDLMRALACALLVAACVQSPATALVVAPLVPAIAAIRLARHTSSRRFQGTVVVAGIVAAVLASPTDAMVGPAIAGAVLLTLVLARTHAIAARRDPAVAGEQPEWPEPRLTSGLTPTIGAWTVALALVAALAWTTGAFPSPRAAATSVIDQAYAPYTDACANGGVLAGQAELCDSIDRQQVDVSAIVDDHAAELFAALAALFVFGAAATAHLVVLGRARLVSGRVRPSTSIERLELHWTFAYVLTCGLVLWLLADPMAGDAATATRSAGAALMGLGGLAVVAQGIGLAWWITARGRRAGLVRTMLVIGALVASPVIAAFLLVLGIVDLAFHPRRRALDARPDPRG